MDAPFVSFIVLPDAMVKLAPSAIVNPDVSYTIVPVSSQFTAELIVPDTFKSPLVLFEYVLPLIRVVAE
jgi:hypothetical protein